MTGIDAENKLIPTVSIVVLAAGRSRRMRDRGHKLLARFDGIALLRRSVLSAIGCHSLSVVVVTGERHDELAETISDLSARVIPNLDHASGMASSIRVGVEAAQEDAPAGILIALADMPAIGAAELNSLIAAFLDHGRQTIVRAAANGAPGNPVIFPSAWFERLKRLSGDVGARALLKDSSTVIVDVEIGDAALIDVDTPEDLTANGGIAPEVNAQGTDRSHVS